MTSSLGLGWAGSRGASMIQVCSIPGGAMSSPREDPFGSRYAGFWSSRAWHQWWTIARLTGSRPTRVGPGVRPRNERASSMSAAASAGSPTATSPTAVILGKVGGFSAPGQEPVLVLRPRERAGGVLEHVLFLRYPSKERAHARGRPRRG